MDFGETLTVSSVERLLTPEEADAVVRLMREVVTAAPPGAFEVARRDRSIHAIPGLSPGEAASVYEPHGRLEVDTVPADVTRLMQAALDRRMDDIRRVLPSVRWTDEWVYVEYRQGEYVAPHVDYPENAEQPSRPKVVGIGVQLNDDVEGGEFYVDTTAASALWRAGAEGLDIAPVANNHSEWFRSLPRTRWVTRAGKGSALLYGTRMVHGTLPVTQGVSRKLIGWLLA